MLQGIKHEIDGLKLALTQFSDDLRNQVNEMNSLLDQSVAEADVTNSELTNITHVLDQLRLTIRDKETTIAKKEQELSSLENQERDENSILRKVEAELEELNGEMTELETELTAKQEKDLTLKQTINSLKHSLSSKESELNSAKNELSTLEQEFLVKKAEKEAEFEKVRTENKIFNYLLTESASELPEAEIIAVIAESAKGVSTEIIKEKVKGTSAVMVFRLIKQLEAAGLIQTRDGDTYSPSPSLANAMANDK
ncbi:MAG: hypothetical protein KAR35_09675 [Candidatus Heimdallarchaeota archaeon]|nr:hypothetical protein [Candidatus Heimdallarchaeota archaeon]MCK5049626.1 hypothetical protein [Candidatus Heimdallarchaeota archaeon]